MNEIEHLIARLDRPSPSPDLDARISELTNRLVPADRPRSLVRQFGLLAASTACAGLAGFAVGRQSVTPESLLQGVVVAPAPAAVTMATATSVDPNPHHPIVSVRYPETEALARFVMPPKRFESLFGDQPLVERSDSSQIE